MSGFEPGLGLSVDAARHTWLRTQEAQLLEWGERAADSRGFGYLDARGHVDPTAGHPLLVTARMTYVYALAADRGHPRAAALRDHGVRSLLRVWRDRDHGGWVSDLGAVGARKSGYDHAFILLAASASRRASPEGEELFEAAVTTVIERFWSAEEGAIIDSFAVDWSDPERYRGANANMHLVEAFLAAWWCSSDRSWLDRALRISERLINEAARDRGWRVLEHFDEIWTPLPQYNADRPADQFRPYGYLVGHSFEWARLLVQLSEAIAQAGRPVPLWLTEAAIALWSHGLAVGWAVDGHPGFVYSLDWTDRVVIDNRLHWVACEAAAAAAVLAKIGLSGADGWAERIWADIESRFVDPVGSWHHELDASGRPSATIWPGKPDLYHAYQAVMLTLERDKWDLARGNVVRKTDERSGPPGRAPEKSESAE